MAKQILIIKHIEIEGPGTLGDFLKQRGRQTETIELEKGDALPSVDECEAIVSLGGPMNVYEEDKYPFLKEEDKFLKQAIREGIPVLGICLGAQLLAKACGARVTKAPQKEIGWYEVKLTEETKTDSLFGGLPERLNIFQWRQDTFEVPKGGVRLSESKYCLNQAFRFGKNAYGLQFHVEVTQEIINSWINKYTEEKLSSVDKENMLSEAVKKKETFKKQADSIYLNFLRIIESSQ